ncbi:MAG: phage tail sheath subtilisin-like domain-containing protein [Clostridia bacterium]|nr:phage tail sheath subtilisin-like domain-containing protein [Clostridia bacterium]
MASGRFDKLAGKVRPGTYVNFESTKVGTVGVGERGIVVIPFIGHSYGPAKEFITITNAAPDAARAKLGFSVFDDNQNMLLVREALKEAATVIVYITASGTTAKGTGGGLTAEAVYGGLRGNDLAYSVVANPLGGFDVTVTLGGVTVGFYEGMKTAAEVIAMNNPYIKFAASGDALTAVAGVNLTGATATENTNSDVTDFLDAVEGVKFNALCFPVSDETLKTAFVSKIKYLRENVGKCVVGVAADLDADYEGITNVTNSVIVGDKELTKEQATAWAAGASAGASNVQSNTYKTYEGATGIVGVKTHEQAVAAIKNGEFFFSVSEEGNVIVEYDINSLVTVPAGKDASYKKNRVIRVFDTFSESLQLNFPPNKYPNNTTGWNIMEGVGRSILKAFEDAGAIKNVDYEADFVVDREASTGDQTFFNVGLEPVDSAEKLYFTVATR